MDDGLGRVRWVSDVARVGVAACAGREYAGVGALTSVLASGTQAGQAAGRSGRGTRSADGRGARWFPEIVDRREVVEEARWPSLSLSTCRAHLAGSHDGLRAAKLPDPKGGAGPVAVRRQVGFRVARQSYRRAKTRAEGDAA